MGKVAAYLADGLGAGYHLGSALGHGLDGFAGGRLNGGDIFLNMLGGLLGFGGQLANLLGNYGKALAGCTSSGSLNGGIQCQQIGLLGNGGNGFYDVADGLGLLSQVVYHAGGCLNAFLNAVHNIYGLVHELGAVMGGTGHILGGGFHRVHLGIELYNIFKDSIDGIQGCFQLIYLGVHTLSYCSHVLRNPAGTVSGLAGTGGKLLGGGGNLLSKVGNLGHKGTVISSFDCSCLRLGNGRSGLNLAAAAGGDE